MLTSGGGHYTPPSTVVLTEPQLRELSRRVKTLLPIYEAGIDCSKDVVKYIDTFSSVITAASSDTLSATHQIAAWNTLSTFLDQTTSHQEVSIRSTLWNAALWQHSLCAFLTRSREARPKSIKQLLISLTNAAQKTRNDPHSSSRLHEAVRPLVETILRRNSQWPIRPCLMLFSNLLRKDIVNLQQFSDIVGAECPSSCSSVLLKSCMQWAIMDECASAAGGLLAVLLDKAEVADSSQEAPWVVTLSFALAEQPDCLDAFRMYLMPVLFKRDHQGYLSFLQLFGINTHLQRARATDNDDFNVLLATLQIGNDCGLVEVTNDTTLDASVCPIRLPLSTLMLLMRHAQRHVRLAGLSLLIDTHSISQPLHEAALDALRANLPHLHADTDLNFRSELFSLTRRSLDRLRASTSHKSRSQHEVQPGIVANSFQVEQRFILWYKRFLMWELRPGASYQRHISALRCLEILMKCGIDKDLPVDSLSKAAKSGGKWPFDINIIDDSFEEVLINSILDSFEDIRQTTARLLDAHIQSRVPSQERHEKLQNAVLVAERMMLASGRADQADAVAHLNALLYSSAPTTHEKDDVFNRLLDKAEGMLDTANASLATAVERYPLHGILTSLRYLLEKPALHMTFNHSTYTRLAVLLRSVWRIVSPILCDDAPEGFVPDGFTESAPVSSKAVLSYCWRALKEASLLTDSILQILSNKNDEWSQSYKADLIELTFTQLAELRHRGAFSTVAQTWNRCCSIAEGIIPPSTLLARVISQIQKATINTRRSAGMPSLLCGIVIAESSGDLLEQAFAQLNAISRQTVQPGLDDESSLPQVHAMNCLRDVLKSTRLANRSEHFVPAALQLAADSLPSKTWAIRNCGLMLFRAVIDRLLGTNDSYEDDTDVKNVMDFRQRKTLLDQVLTLLPSLEHDVVLEGVFPALQLLQHSLLPEDRKAVVQQAVTMLLGNKSWLVRDKAARTLVNVATRQTILSENVARLQQYKSYISSHNMLHGSLLCLKHLVRVASRRQNIAATSEGELDRDLLGELLGLLQHFVGTIRSSALRDTAQVLYREVNDFLGAPSHRAYPDSVDNDTTQMLKAEQVLCSFSSPNLADRWLLDRGSWLNRQVHGQVTESDDAFLTAWEDYTTACELAIAAESIFSSRELASILSGLDKGLRYLWQSAHGRKTLLRICLLVYDLLNDDDEEVRMKASCASSTILSLGEREPIEGNLEPIIASRKLLAFMVANNAANDHFAKECLRRAFNIDRTPTERIDQLLDDASPQDTDLFAEEKQNLYLDGVLEAKAWSQAAKKLRSFGRADFDEVTCWTDVALERLLRKAQSVGPEAYGWSTTESVFAFGLTVIYAVEVLLHHVANVGDKLSIPPSLLREKLLKLRVASKTADLHPLWRFELERVSNIAAVSRFSAIQSLLNGVVGQLSSATTL